MEEKKKKKKKKEIKQEKKKKKKKIEKKSEKGITPTFVCTQAFPLPRPPSPLVRMNDE